MKLKSSLLMLMTLCTMTTFGYWRYKASNDVRPVAQVVIIRDPSDSTPSDCSRVVGLAERALDLPDAGPGTTITLLAAGDERTSNEPRLLAKFNTPIIRRA